MLRFKPTFQLFLALTIAIGLILLFAFSLPTLAALRADTTIGTADSGANFYTPSNATIKVGETITFTNSGLGFHNVDFDTDAEVPGGIVPDGFTADSPSTAEWTRTVTFDKPGEYFFFCTPHRAAGMTGVITVEAEPQYIYLPLITR